MRTVFFLTRPGLDKRALAVRPKNIACTKIGEGTVGFCFLHLSPSINIEGRLFLINFTMLLTKAMLEARALLVGMLSFLSNSASFWYTINGDPSYDFSLCRRIGFRFENDWFAFLVGAGLGGYEELGGSRRFSIFVDQWRQLIDSSDCLDPKLFSINKKAFDIQAVVEHRKQSDSERSNFHTIRIGHESSDSCKHISEQVKWDPKPPTIHNLNSMQRNFTRNQRRLIADTILNNNNVFQDVMEGNPLSAKPKPPPSRKRSVSSQASHTPPPAKKRCDGVGTLAQPTPSPLIAEGGVQLKRGWGKFGALAYALGKLEGDIVDEPPEEEMDLLLGQMIALKQMKSGDNLAFKYKHGNGKVRHFVHVPVNESSTSFQKYRAWIDVAMEINGAGSKLRSAGRIAKHIGRRYASAFKEAMKELHFSVAKKMSAVRISAMFKAGNVHARTNRRQILRHLRHHFGKHSFESEKQVQMLSEGHTKVMTGSVEYSYEDGAAPETIDFAQKNIAEEAAAQIASQLRAKHIEPEKIERLDIIPGGDHGKGAFILGARIVVRLVEPLRPNGEGEEAQSYFSFEISVAEVICRKDNAEILSMTIKDELTKGLRTIAENKLTFYRENGLLACKFGDVTSPHLASHQVKLYNVGDLAWYGIPLGKEGMSGKWCHICQLSAKEFADLTKTGTLWTHPEMKRLGDEYQRKLKQAIEEAEQKARKARKPISEVKPKEVKPEKGMKEAPWWPFIPVAAFVVPLLHCLIGVGNDVLSRFREIVSEEIEYISPDEIAVRESASAMSEKIEDVIQERKTFDATKEGKQRAYLKNKIYRAEVALGKLGVVASVEGTSGAVKSTANEDFITEIMDFIHNDVDSQSPEDDGDDNDDPTPREPGEDGQPRRGGTEAEGGAVRGAVGGAVAGPVQQKIEAVAGPVQQNIEAVKKIIEECKKQLSPLDRKRGRITSRLQNARAYLTKIKAKITEFKRSRKRSGDGVESKMISILKTMFGVEVQAYHGGSLTGKDIQKVMSNASEIFELFAELLKANKKENCSMSDKQIEDMCGQFANLCVLWDGAFSIASKVDPSDDDILHYSRFVKAAVHSHVEVGCNVTPKVHLMWAHVATQMKEIPGGLGHKREDWVEHLHQVTSRQRAQFRSTKEKELRANAMARSLQQNTDPFVEEWGTIVDDAACRGARQAYVTKEAERKKRRDESRARALSEWEKRHANRKRGMEVCTMQTHNVHG